MALYISCGFHVNLLQDALLLLTVAFPMFACTDPGLVQETEQKIANSLKGRCGTAHWRIWPSVKVQRHPAKRCIHLNKFLPL